MDACAERAPIGAEGLFVFPHFCGGGAPWWDHQRRGAMIGLSLSHDASHIIRAILESTAMEMNANLEVIEGLGLQVESVRIVGGGATSRIWRQIIGDVLGKPQIRMKEVEVGALGAAILASVGTGVFADLDQAVEAMVVTGESNDFSEENHQEYRYVYSQYREWSQRLYGAMPWEEPIQVDVETNLGI
jgi:xylulokinase